MAELGTVRVGGYDVPVAALAAAREAIGSLIPSSVDSPELTEIAKEALAAALPYLIPKEWSIPQRHIHYHVPEGAVLTADGETVRIEPALVVDASAGWKAEPTDGIG